MIGQRLVQKIVLLLKVTINLQKHLKFLFFWGMKHTCTNIVDTIPIINDACDCTTDYHLKYGMIFTIDCNNMLSHPICIFDDTTTTTTTTTSSATSTMSTATDFFNICVQPQFSGTYYRRMNSTKSSVTKLTFDLSQSTSSATATTSLLGIQLQSLTIKLYHTNPQLLFSSTSTTSSSSNAIDFEITTTTSTKTIKKSPFHFDQCQVSYGEEQCTRCTICNDGVGFAIDCSNIILNPESSEFFQINFPSTDITCIGFPLATTKTTIL